jgi:predicted transcriptional regulator
LISKKDYFMNEKAVTLRNDHIRQTVKVVAAYISNNSLPAAELPSLIFGIYSALSGLRQGGASEAPMVEKPTPAQIHKSITHDALISFIDGKPYKTLKRHLTGNGMTVAQYRERYVLPLDYPTVAISYSQQRSTLAKSFGLGSQRRETTAKATITVGAEAPKKRGRKTT